MQATLDTQKEKTMETLAKILIAYQCAKLAASFPIVHDRDAMARHAFNMWTGEGWAGMQQSICRAKADRLPYVWERGKLVRYYHD